jgi:predicted nucleic acid-binding protein
MTFQKLTASVSDTDILINFGKIDRLDVIDLLFDKIVVPKKITEELVRIDRHQYTKVHRKTYDTQSGFEFQDRHKDKVLNRLARDTIEYYREIIGPGEAECAGYAKASNIDIIISDNYTEFEELEEEFIMLTHRDLIFLCFNHNLLTRKDAEALFSLINQNLDRPTKITFDEWHDRSITRMHEKGWNKILGV